MRTHDALAALPPDLVGRRVSLRLLLPDGPTDRIGVVIALDAAALTLERRSGAVETVRRKQIHLARVIPTVPRGRNPLHAPAELLGALAHTPELEAFEGPCWVARLCDLIDHLDDSGVRRPTPTSAARGASRGVVNGEWSALRLAAAEDLDPLAAWAARRDARNVVLTSGLADEVLLRLGLVLLPD